VSISAESTESTESTATVSVSALSDFTKLPHDANEIAVKAANTKINFFILIKI
jgi:hypothetical protein